MTNVVAFVGTATRDGLVSRMCDRVLEGAADAGASTELVNLYDHEIERCIGCWSCYRKGSCFRDDDFEALFVKLRGADAVVLGSPDDATGVPRRAEDRAPSVGMMAWMSCRLRVSR